MRAAKCAVVFDCRFATLIAPLRRGHDVMIGSGDPGKPELREWLAASADAWKPARSQR
jgi:hypothetical protein